MRGCGRGRELKEIQPRHEVAPVLSLASVSPAPFGLIEFSGPERNDFLNRLLSNEMRLAPGAACAAYFLNVQGRPLIQFWAFQTTDSTWLVCPAEQTTRAMEELDALHFGEKLRMSDRTAEWHSTLLLGAGRRDWILENLGLTCDQRWAAVAAPDILWCVFPWLASGSELIWSKQPLVPVGAPLTPDVLLLERIQAARPLPSDWGEKTLFLEVADADDYVDGKGCYPGQEVVARTLHRGHVNRHLGVIHGEGPPPAPEARLRAADKEVGWVTTAAPSPAGWYALAYVRREVAEPGTQLQLESGQTCHVLSPRREA
jgi:tRNA-modifying protein YgfZ